MKCESFVYKAPEMYLEDMAYEYMLCASLPPIQEEWEQW